MRRFVKCKYTECVDGAITAEISSPDFINETEHLSFNGIDCVMLDRRTRWLNGSNQYDYTFVPAYYQAMRNNEVTASAFSMVGTRQSILDTILQGSGMTGVIDYPSSGEIVFSSGAKNHLALLYEFAASESATVRVNGTTISLVGAHRTSSHNVVKYYDLQENFSNGNVTVKLINDNKLNIRAGDYVSLNNSITRQVKSVSFDPLSLDKAITLQLTAFPYSLEADYYNQQVTGVKTGQNYYGMRITYDNGITIERDDGYSKSTFNSDVFEMCSLKNGIMTPAIYFDSVERVFKITGNIIIDGEAIAQTIIVNDLYAENGNVVSMTVDSMNSDYDRPFRYLREDTGDINYITIDGETIRFMRAICFPHYEPVQFGDGSNGYYWTDSSHTKMTVAETEYPVMVYQYEETTVGSWLFASVSGGKYPEFTLTNPAGDVLRILPTATGFEISDSNNSLYFLNSGITVNGSGTTGLANITAAVEAPNSPHNNDIWVDLGNPIEGAVTSYAAYISVNGQWLPMAGCGSIYNITQNVVDLFTPIDVNYS